MTSFWWILWLVWVFWFSFGFVKLQVSDDLIVVRMGIAKWNWADCRGGEAMAGLQGEHGLGKEWVLARGN